MKRGVIIFILFLLIIFPLISAIDFQMKESFARGETILGKVSGNFFNEPFSDNIYLYRKNGQIQVPIKFKVDKLGEDYYLYGQTFKEGNPLEEDNYSIVIKNVKYIRVLGEISSEDIIKNFTVNSKIADFLVEPGFVKTEDNFTLSVKNLQDKKIDIRVIASEVIREEENSSSNSTGLWERLFGKSNIEKNVSYQGGAEQIVSLIPGEDKEIKIISYRSSQNVVKTLALETENNLYNIPVYVSASKISEPENVTIIEKNKFYFQTELIEEKLPANETLEKKIILWNKAGTEVSNITVEYTYSLEGALNITPQKIGFMSDEENREILLKIGLSKGELNKLINGSLNESNYYGFIKAASAENFSTKIEVNLTFFKTEVPQVKPGEKTCSGLGGLVCNETTRCVGETKYLREENKAVICCFGTCETSSPGSFWKFIGWIILVIVILFLVWFFLKKYRGAKNEVNLMRVATGKK